MSENPKCPDVKSRLTAKFTVDTETGCWVWNANKTPGGYGRIWVDAVRRMVVAHRISYELHVGKIPDGLDLDHLCRNRACVNPAHLEPVSRAVNNQRTPRCARQTCKEGHALNPSVDYSTRGDGRRFRQCRICYKKYKHLYDERIKNDRHKLP